MHDGSPHGIGELGIQDLSDPLLDRFIFNREEDLYPTIQVTRHPVRTGAIVFLVPIIIEIIDTAVFQKLSNDRTDLNILTQADNART